MILLGFLQDQIQSPFCHALALAKPPPTQTFLAQMQLRPCSSRVLPVQPTEVGGRPNLRRDPCSPIGSLVGVALNQKDSPVCHSSSVSSATQVAGVERRDVRLCTCILYAASSVCIRYRGDDSIRQALTITCRRIYLPVLHLV